MGNKKTAERLVDLNRGQDGRFVKDNKAGTTLDKRNNTRYAGAQAARVIRDLEDLGQTGVAWNTIAPQYEEWRNQKAQAYGGWDRIHQAPFAEDRLDHLTILKHLIGEIAKRAFAKNVQLYNKRSRRVYQGVETLVRFIDLFNSESDKLDKSLRHTGSAKYPTIDEIRDSLGADGEGD